MWRCAEKYYNHQLLKAWAKINAQLEFLKVIAQKHTCVAQSSASLQLDTKRIVYVSCLSTSSEICLFRRAFMSAALCQPCSVLGSVPVSPSIFCIIGRNANFCVWPSLRNEEWTLGNKSMETEWTFCQPFAQSFAKPVRKTVRMMPTELDPAGV